MAGGETQTPVQERARFTESQVRLIRAMAENIAEEKIRRMGGGVRYEEKRAAFEKAKVEALAWARENNIGTWPS